MASARRVASIMLAAMAVLWAPSVSADGLLEENWYALYLMGQKAGHQHETLAEEEGPDGPLYRTTVEIAFTVKRLDMPMTFAIETGILEDATGQVREFRQSIEGALSFVQEGRREGDEMLVSRRAGGVPTVSRIAAHDGLGPWGLRCLQERMGLEPGTTYTAEAFVPDAPGLPVPVHVTIRGQEDVQVFEVRKHLHRADTRMDLMGGLTSSTWFDGEGTVWLATVAMPGNMTLESRRTTRVLALGENDPADILAASFVRPDRPIPNPRRVKRLRLRLTSPTGEAATWGLESGPFQQVEAREGGCEVTLRQATGSPERSYALPYAGAEYADLLQANVWMETRDRLVLRMARKAVGAETDALAAVRRIEAYVREAITGKNLSLGFATAAEAAEQKAGDCTEHAVLAAAMARAAGMPSRVVGGLVYVDELPGTGGGGFGYHMWTEVFVGEWFPIDAALGGHDATHLVLARSALNGTDELFMLSAAISRVFGGLAVEVLEVE
ncbi:MAG: transglutaminase domain-containing protein [Candidatus Brocadiaceae bacterium]|nr:transglutaminase domain-containing protein [Candidatus Brocadiaceae bacterium]